MPRLLPLLYYCDPYDIPLPAGHKFPMEKYKLLREALERAGGFRFALGPLAKTDDLARVHEARYLESFLTGSLSPEQVRKIGFPNVPELISRSLSSVGATVAASGVALDEGWAGVLAGGTHHAFRDHGSGFCALNDIAVAAARLLHFGKAQRIAVIDLDVHQGDGTASIFADEERVFTFSAHCEANFPFLKQKSDLDLAFASGTSGEEYLAGLRMALPRVFEFEPDFVFYQAGVDGLATDRLGKLALTMEDLRERDRLVIEAMKGRPFVVTLGGGYSEPSAHTIAAAAQTYLVIMKRPTPDLRRGLR